MAVLGGGRLAAARAVGAGRAVGAAAGAGGPAGPGGRLLRAAAEGPAAFGDLVAATPLPAVARAHALHLLWRRRLGIDLARPLGDRSLVWLAGGTG